jgi:hypothetical protein
MVEILCVMYENGKMINYSRNGGKKDKRMMVGVN